MERIPLARQYPVSYTHLDVYKRQAQTLFKLIDTLDDDDDVQTVWGNYEIPDAVMEKLG